MQLGYLTRDGRFVGLDTFGNLTLFSAYRIEEPARTMSFFTNSSPLEFEGSVQVTMNFHRHGWGKKGVTVLDRRPARLYATKTAHILVGDWFRSIKHIRPFGGQAVALPTLAGNNPLGRAQWAALPRRHSPFVLLLQDPSIRACRLRGSHVELFGTEQKEFSDFTMSKLTVSLDFPTEEEARRFAKDFTNVENSASLDTFVHLDVDRSQKIVWTRNLMAGVAFLVVFAVLVAYLTLYLSLTSGSPARAFVGVSLMTLLLSVFAIVFYADLPKNYRERFDYAQKWPAVAMERWGQDFRHHASGFAHACHELNFAVDIETGDLESLDKFIRSIPSDGFFLSFAWAVAAYVSSIFLDSIGRKLPFEWRYLKREGQPVLYFPGLNYWYAPLTWVRLVWVERKQTTLNAMVAESVEELSLMFAFVDVAGFHVTGFLEDERQDPMGFARQIKEEVKTEEFRSHMMGEAHFRESKKRYGLWEIHYFELEVAGPRETRLLPEMAIPFHADAQCMVGTLDGVTPRHPNREDLTFVRLEGHPMSPIGLQVLNYIEVGPIFFQAGRKVELELMAVADKAQVVTTRARVTMDKVADFVAPLELDSEGLPMLPLVSFLGAVEWVKEDVNPLTGVQFWRVCLMMGSLAFEILVRKDKCLGVPNKGQFLTGTAWLVARFVESARARTDYIG